MHPDEYQTLALTTLNPKTREHTDRMLVNGALGLAGEAGEVADLLKKAFYHDQGLTQAINNKLIIELGDVLWYVALLAQALGVTIDEIMQLNIAKLKARYPEGFDAVRSSTKNEQAEQAAIRSGSSIDTSSQEAIQHMRKGVDMAYNKPEQEAVLTGNQIALQRLEREVRERQFAFPRPDTRDQAKRVDDETLLGGVQDGGGADRRNPYIPPDYHKRLENAGLVDPIDLEGKVD